LVGGAPHPEAGRNTLERFDGKPSYYNVGAEGGAADAASGALDRATILRRGWLGAPAPNDVGAREPISTGPQGGKGSHHESGGDIVNLKGLLGLIFQRLRTLWRALAAIGVIIGLVTGGLEIVGYLPNVFHHGSTRHTVVSTPTPVAPSPCPGQAPATAEADFSDLPFPASARTSSGGQFRPQGPNQYSICETNLSLSKADSAAYGDSLQNAGWMRSPKAPFDGAYLEPCDQRAESCWTRRYAPDGRPRYVAVGKPQAAGQRATIRLELFFPPDLPLLPCAGNFDPGPNAQYPAFLFAGPAFVPLPPMSLFVTDSARTNIHYVCSSGTADSITAFLVKYLPKQGFIPVSGAGSPGQHQQTWQWQGGGGTVVTVSWVVDDPGDWTITNS
jgi:hypothetical protein